MLNHISTGATVNALLWCIVELNLGIFGGCVTAIRPFIRKYFPRLLGPSSGDGYSSQSRSRKHGHPLGSIPHSDRVNFSNQDNQYSTTLSVLRGAPDNGSEEHILASHPSGHAKDGDGSNGIIRTVEFDVKNSSTTA